MNNTKREKLITAIVNRPEEFNCKLEALKKEGKRISRLEDWLWYELLCSMSTLGGTRGYYGLMLNKERLEKISYNILLELNKHKRLKLLTEVLREANVNFYPTKARYLVENIEKIESFGGLQKIQSHILSLKGRELKLNFISTLSGIGIAYSRNIFMDLCDPDFTESIKIDSRLKKIIEQLEMNTTLPYCEHEEAFIAIAKETNVTPWELDRLLYNYKEHFISSIIN